jgi:hypothetical protein
MYDIGIAFIGIGAILIIWTLLIQVRKDKLPPFLTMTVRLDNEFPPGIVLSKRAVWLWISGAFWGAGVVLMIFGFDKNQGDGSELILIVIYAFILLGLRRSDRKRRE